MIGVIVCNLNQAMSTIEGTGLGSNGSAVDLPVGRLVERAVQSPLQKYFASPVGQIISTNSRHPTPQEGRIMIVTDAGWNAVDAAAFGARWDRRAGSLNL